MRVVEPKEILTQDRGKSAVKEVLLSGLVGCTENHRGQKDKPVACGLLVTTQKRGKGERHRGYVPQSLSEL